MALGFGAVLVVAFVRAPAAAAVLEPRALEPLFVASVRVPVAATVLEPRALGPPRAPLPALLLAIIVLTLMSAVGMAAASTVSSVLDAPVGVSVLLLFLSRRGETSVHSLATTVAASRAGVAAFVAARALEPLRAP